MPCKEIARIVAAVFADLVAFRCFKEVELPVALLEPLLYTCLVPGLGGTLPLAETQLTPWRSQTHHLQGSLGL